MMNSHDAYGKTTYKAISMTAWHPAVRPYFVLQK